jgi:oxygen-dependent protoporphyrinogen oxidase
METRRVTVAIIGGGVSGLSVAHWLNKQQVDVVVLEKEPEVGGTMKTIRENGFLVETGPNNALETTPLFRELMTDCALQEEFTYTSPAGENRYILRDGRLIALPLNAPAFITSRLFSTSAKLRLLKEPFIGRAEREESVAEFVVRRLGREFLDYAVDPFVAGIFAGQPEALSVRAAFPRLYALEEKYGGLVKGMIGGRRERKQRAEKAKDRAESFSFLNGMQTLPLALARDLRSRVLTDAEVKDIRPENRRGGRTENGDTGRFIVEYTCAGRPAAIGADCVVVSIPAHAASPIVRPLSVNASTILDSIRYSPVASIFLGFRAEDVHRSLAGFGFLVPSRERRKILGCLWSSSLFLNRAPDGAAALTTFVGGGRQPELVDLGEDALCDLALSEVKNIMQIEGKHVYLRLTRWRNAIPQYELGHLDKIGALSRLEGEYPGLFFCSNFKGGISVGDCVKSARETTDRVLQSLKESSVHIN